MASSPQGVRIDELAPTALPSSDAVVPVMFNGQTFRYAISQFSTMARIFDGTESDFSFASTSLGAAVRELGNAVVLKANADAVALSFSAVDDALAATATALTRRVRVDAGQSFTSSEKVQARANVDAVGNLFKRTRVTASGVFNFDAETKFALVEVLGGGGAGGGAQNGTVNSGGAGSGGGAGGLARKFFALGSITSATITIGAGGTGVSGAGGNGGGNSVYDDGVNILTGNGGSGGESYVGVSNVHGARGGKGGTATGGDDNTIGASGAACFSAGTSASGAAGLAMAQGGNGAPSPFGGGALGVFIRGTSANGGNGDTSAARGAGGSGAAQILEVTNRAGGDGGNGLVVIWEFK